jgi:hypothetical protein
VALLEKLRFLYNHSGDFPQVILIIPSHVPNNLYLTLTLFDPLPLQFMLPFLLPCHYLRKIYLHLTLTHFDPLLLQFMLTFLLPCHYLYIPFLFYSRSAPFFRYLYRYHYMTVFNLDTIQLLITFR